MHSMYVWGCSLYNTQTLHFMYRVKYLILKKGNKDLKKVWKQVRIVALQLD